MKASLIFFSSFCAGIILLLCLMTGKPYVQKVMEKEVLTHVDAKSFANFQSVKVTLLKDEIRDSLLYYRMKISWDKCFLELYQDIYDEPAKAEHYRTELIKDQARQDYFNSMNDRYDLLNKVSTITYRISYLYEDETGNDKIEIFDACFNERKNMIAYRLNSQSEWVNVNF